MTINQLATKIAKLEGKKSQARIGDLREIIGILSDLVFQDYCDYLNGENSILVEMLIVNGQKRSKRKKK